MSKELELESKNKTYLRKKGLRKRYDCCEKTIDRYRKMGRIPKPDFYIGPVPFWSEERLDAVDRANKKSRPPEMNELKRGLKEYQDRRKAKADRKSMKESIRA